MRRRALPVALLIAALTAVGAAAAFAARGDPQEELRPTDQARAKALLLDKADIGGPVDVDRSPSQDDKIYCKGADQSSLTITGKAKSPLFSAHGIEDVAFSSARIYISLADASAAWQRATNSSALACAAAAARRAFHRPGYTFISLRRVPFASAAAETFAYRLTIRVKGQLGYFDFILLHYSRAAASLVFGSDLVPWAKADQIRIARLIAKRMATAMHG